MVKFRKKQLPIDIISTRTSRLMMRETKAVAIPRMHVALAGVPVKGHTWSRDLKRKKKWCKERKLCYEFKAGLYV